MNPRVINGAAARPRFNIRSLWIHKAERMRHMEILYKKEYAMTASGNVVLKNPEPAIAYIQKQVEALVAAEGDVESQRDVKLTILSDFTAIYDYDLMNAKRPEPFGSFESADQKSKFIEKKQLIEDFSLYLGSIFANYQEWLIRNNKVKLADFQPFIVNYNELYRIALAEYARVILEIPHPIQVMNKQQQASVVMNHAVKEVARSTEVMEGEGFVSFAHTDKALPLRREHACATTYILPSLIEFSLNTALENYVIYEWLDGVKKLSGATSFDPDEQKLINVFIGATGKGADLIDGDKNTSLQKIWNMGVKYGIFSDQDKDKKEALCGVGGRDLTIGKMLHSGFVKTKIRDEYFKVLDYLFGTEHMDIRNCIAHGKSVTYDYLDVGIASVMLQILQDIGSRDVFVG